jgi:nitroreductase
MGAVWTAVHPDVGRTNGVRKLFGIPEYVIPLCIIPIGYPAEKKSVEKRYKEEKVHAEKW